MTAQAVVVRRFVLVCLTAASFFVGASLLEGCDPATRRAWAPAIEPLQRATCVILQSVTSSGRALDICATAEELAPFVAEILAVRAAAHEPAQRGPVLAFSLGATPRKPARWRCVEWVPIASFGEEGGTDGSQGSDRGVTEGGGYVGGCSEGGSSSRGLCDASGRSD